MYNPYIVIPFAAWVIAQTIKFTLAAWRGKIDFKNLYGSGGMPSGHSALVTALATTALLLEGPSSSLFGVTAVLAAIVMYDSFGVRRSSGEQAAVLNILIANQSIERSRVGQPVLHRLREVLGHTPIEVAAGAVIGSILAVAFNGDKARPAFEFLAAIPVRLELLVYASVFGALIVTGVVARLAMARRYRGSAVIKTLSKQILVLSQSLGWPGVVAVFAQFERVPYLSWRLWPLGLLVGGLAWSVELVRRYYKVLPKALAEEKEQARRQKWLVPRRKKKKSRV